MSLRNFLSLTFLVVLGDAIAEALPIVAAQADMLETIGMAALEAGGLDCGAVTDPPPPPHSPQDKGGGTSEWREKKEEDHSG